MPKMSMHSPCWLSTPSGLKRAVFYGYKPGGKVKVRPEYESCITVPRNMVSPRERSAAQAELSI